MRNSTHDRDLTPLLRQCDNDELSDIVDIILSSPRETLSLSPAYRRHRGDHHAYLDEIVNEISSLGGNSIANRVRGRGVLYEQMVRDVARLLGVSVYPTHGAMDSSADADAASRRIRERLSTERIEELIIMRLLALARNHMDETDRLALAGLLELTDGADGSEHRAEYLSERLATTATSLDGHRLRRAIDAASVRASRRATSGSLFRTAVVMVAARALGRLFSVGAAAGQSIVEALEPARSLEARLIARIGLLRHKHAQMYRDMREPSLDRSWAAG